MLMHAPAPQATIADEYVHTNICVCVIYMQVPGLAESLWLSGHSPDRSVSLKQF